MGKHDSSRSHSRSLSRNEIECKSDIKKRKKSSTSSYKEKKRRKCSPSPSRSRSKIRYQDKSGKYSSELNSKVDTKKYCKREISSSSTNTSRSSSNSDSSDKKHRKHKRKKRSKRHSSTSESGVSSSSESRSSCSSSSTVAKKKRRKEKKRRKDKKRRKEKKAKRKLKRKKERLSIGPEIKPIEIEMPPALSTVNKVIEVTDRAKAMAPMTKEEWEKRQSVIRRVFDEETGRHRLIKGDGEVLEEIVSRDRHREINRQATKGDGDFFLATLAAKQCK